MYILSQEIKIRLQISQKNIQMPKQPSCKRSIQGPTCAASWMLRVSDVPSKRDKPLEQEAQQHARKASRTSL